MRIRKLSIVIPAYNEARTIATLLDRVWAAELGDIEKEVIVVDDGSRDATRSLAAAYRPAVTVLAHERNRGKGAAVRTGFAAATGDYVVVQDADLEYDPRDFKAMLAAAEEKGVRAVFGSRILGHVAGMGTKGAAPYYLGGKAVTFAANLLYGTGITDEPTCYKMVEKSLIGELALEATGFEFCPEITAKLAKRGVRICEVPIHYQPRTTAEGKKLRFKDGVIALWTLLKYRI